MHGRRNSCRFVIADREGMQAYSASLRVKFARSYLSNIGEHFALTFLRSTNLSLPLILGKLKIEPQTNFNIYIKKVDFFC